MDLFIAHICAIDIILHIFVQVKHFAQICDKIFLGMEIVNMINYSDALKEQREKANLTQNALAKATGISHQNISRWEKGTILPNIDFCVKLADFYNISLDELIGRN